MGHNNSKEKQVIIFNNYLFENSDYFERHKLYSLYKNLLAVNEIEKLFCDKLGYNINICENYTHSDIIDKISNLLNYFETNKPSIIIIFVLTYHTNNFIHAADKSYPLQDIIRTFTLNKNLENIPKVYFIQTEKSGYDLCCNNNNVIDIQGSETLILRSINNNSIINEFCLKYKYNKNLLNNCIEMQSIPPSHIMISTLTKMNYNL
ncbi:putative caspase-2 [Betaentomopoxvirus amoorei]|uniref:AMV063 n=1 Tax=Amsacta moorei entomopoxvirus TaxID=28321 RepID=Q9EMY6_AMEPV|nr:putative caspase-2 [Amsacta moorei entomopoxvirus]AAG02769.1 AMV063 [Amsacta moorei entomopoxvirus]